MASGKKGKSGGILEKVAAFIVDKRKAIYLVYIIMLIFCVVASNWVKVNNTLTDYLSEDTETHQGLSIMDDEFVTYATAKIMVDNVSYDRAEQLVKEIEDIDGIKEVEFDETQKHYYNSSALFSITFDGQSDDEICQTALAAAEDKLSAYDIYVSAELGDTKADRIAKEISMVMVIVAIIIVSVLLFTSKTYMEIPTLLITFIAAALLNKGTNFMMGTISFISNSVAVVLQLALAIDYAIILCHRYTEERVDKAPREAVITALCKAIPEISGSCLTTISGLAAMTFMHFKIGYDMGVVLIKSIFLSILVVFTLMPGLLMTFSSLIDRTHHKNFVPEINVWGRVVVRLKYILPGVFLVVLVAACVFSNLCPYAYSYTNLTTFTKNDSQIADEMISETFKMGNTLAVLVPRGDYDKEKQLIDDLVAHSEIDTVKGLANVEAMNGYAVADKLTPRQFAELTDVDIEQVRVLYSAYAVSTENYGRVVGGIDEYGVPLVDMFDYLYDQVKNKKTLSLGDEMDSKLDDINEALSDGKKQLLGENYSRIVCDLNLPEESEDTFAFLDVVRETAQKYYPENVYLVGNSTSDLDLSSTFGQDNILISILSVLFVILVLLFTFNSAGLPIILILVIQGSVWINFSFPYLENSPLFFLSYLVVSSIQMGANIDYAIVITNRFTELKKEMPVEKAAIQAISQAFPTILTSGSILAASGFIIGFMSSDAAISSIGICLGRGTLISIFLVMSILPQLLLLGNKIIDKTSFTVKAPFKQHTGQGRVAVDGRIRGYINGRVDGTFSGTVDGGVDASIISGSITPDDDDGEDRENTEYETWDTRSDFETNNTDETESESDKGGGGNE